MHVCPHRAVSALLVPLALAVWAPAQAVPAAHAAKDAPGFGWLAGLPVGLRQQVVVDARHLAPLRGKTLTGVWLRRDTSDRDALAGGVIDVQVTISSNPKLAADRPDPVFDRNHGRDRTAVFAGRVPVPSSPALGVPRGPWDPRDTIRIGFTRSFVYSAGALCVEIRGRPVPGGTPKFWPIDYDNDGVGGKVAAVGASCTPLRFAGTTHAWAWPSSLRPGATMLLSTHARPGTTALLMLSASLAWGTKGLSLASFGAPGCRLWLDGALTQVQAVGSSWFAGAGTPAQTFARLPLPADQTLLGAAFYAQWAFLEHGLPPRQPRSNPAGVTTTNAVRATLAARAASSGIAVVEAGLGSRVPATGRVRLGTGPVLRFVTR